MSDQLLECAVVGLGMGEQHARALLQDPRCQLKYVVDFDQSKARKFIEDNHLTDVGIRSFSEVVEDKTINLITLASYDDHHYEQTLQCIKHLKHIFVEKPLCQTLNQLNNIHTHWKDTQVELSSNLVLRKAPLYIWLKDFIQRGELGEIYSFDGDYLYGRVQKITEGWRKDIENYSVMQGGGIHIVDLMLWLTGQKPCSVSSTKNKIATQNTSFRYHDFHSAVFTFPSGLIGRVTANFGCVHRHQHVIRIFGTKGTFLYDDLGPRIYWNRDEEGKPEFLPYAPKPPANQKGALVHNLVDNIMQGKSSANTQREFDLMSVVLAADESMSYVKPLTIEYFTC